MNDKHEQTSNDAAISVQGLCKEYRTGFLRKRVNAVDEVSFEVKRGEVFGFVGPNGAGKTTTIRTLMGLIRPTRGRCFLLGNEVPSRAARRKVGFLPESPYFYDYLSGRELMHLTGRLFGVDPALRKRRAEELLARVGLAAAADRPMRKYSKGMLQRAGLAQALMNDPELLVLDEPMSGLDPVGRFEVRDLIVEQARAGKTIFFSTHILPDVEAICDRVAIISHGKIHDVGPVKRVLDAQVLGINVHLEVPVGRTVDDLLPAGASAKVIDTDAYVELPSTIDADAWLRALPVELKIRGVEPRTETLEALYMRATRADRREEDAGGR
jgi:ABC-2 type transport system ATP-binding protein